MHNDLSLHCTDFFLERRNRSYYLHCLEEVDLQMRSRWGRGGGGEPLANHHHHDLIETSFGGHDLQTMEIIRSVSSFEKNPYNVSSNLSLSRAHFSKVHVFCEVHGGHTGGCGGHGGRTLPIYSSSKLQLPSSGLIAHSVALSPLNWVVREVRGGHGGRFSTYMRLRTYILHILWCMKYHILSTAQIAHL